MKAQPSQPSAGSREPTHLKILLVLAAASEPLRTVVAGQRAGLDRESARRLLEWCAKKSYARSQLIRAPLELTRPNGRRGVLDKLTAHWVITDEGRGYLRHFESERARVSGALNLERTRSGSFASTRPMC